MNLKFGSIATAVAVLSLATSARAVNNGPSGAPFVPGSWTMVVMPDTQNMIKDPSKAGIVTQMTQWIVDNKADRNIQFVLHAGDVVENNNQTEWDLAKASFSLLDGVVPYAITLGSHDVGPGGDGTDRESLFFNDPQYFGPGSPYATQPTLQGFYESGKTDNAYQMFSAGGQDYLVVSTEWAPRDEVLGWANDIIAANPERNAILLTHAYLGDESNIRYDWDTLGDAQHWNSRDPNKYGTPLTDTANDGQDMWDELVRQNANLGMVIAGHSSTATGGNYLLSQGDNGNDVHQIVFNAQLFNGGDGWMRLLEFQPDGNIVSIKTYSPFLNRWATNSTNQFTIVQVPVPEPNCLLLALLGGTLSLAIRKNRSH